MTVPLEGGEWSAARPGRTLPPGKTRYPFYMRLSGPQGRSGRAKILVPTGIRSRTVQPVVSRCNYRATRPTTLCIKATEKTRKPLGRFLGPRNSGHEYYCLVSVDKATVNLVKIRRPLGEKCCPHIQEVDGCIKILTSQKTIIFSNSIPSQSVTSNSS